MGRRLFRGEKTMAGLLKKADLVNSKRERKYRTVTIPSYDQDEHPGTVTLRIRKMFSAEHIAFRNSLTDDKGVVIAWRSNNTRQLAAAFCWVDEDGARVLQDEDILAEWWQRTDPAFVACLCYEAEQFNEGGFRFSVLENERKNLPETAGSEPSIESADISENQTPASSSTE
jgi:hypothetical protein